MPSSFYGAEGKSQNLSGFCLREAFIIEKVDDFLLCFREFFDLGMEFAPACEVFRLIGLIVKCSITIVRWLVVGVMFFCNTKRTKMMSSEVDQLASDLESCQIEEVTHGFYRLCGECIVEPKHGVLEHVVGLLPATQAWIGVKHLASESLQAFTGMGKQGVIGGGVSVQATVDQYLKLGVASCRGRLSHDLALLMKAGGGDAPSYTEKPSQSSG